MGRKLIVSDVDGTLLNSEKHVSEGTREKILSLIEAGHVFAIATGRMHAAGRMVTQELDYDGFLISCNGAVVKHLKTGETLHAVPLPTKAALEIIHLCQETHAYFHLYTPDVIYAESNMSFAKRYAEGMASLPESLRFEVRFVADAAEIAADRPIHKIGLWHDDPEVMRRIEAHIREMGSLETCKSYETSFDVMASGVTKASGIEAIRMHYNLAVQDIIAFGDNENDLDMIRYAGHGVAMANATEVLRTAADYVTLSNDEDGIVHALERMGL